MTISCYYITGFKIGISEQFQYIISKIITNHRIRQIIKLHRFRHIYPLSILPSITSSNQNRELFVFFFRLYILHIHKHALHIRAEFVQHQRRSLHARIQYAPTRIGTSCDKAAEVTATERLVARLDHDSTVEDSSQLALIIQHLLHTVEEGANQVFAPSRIVVVKILRGMLASLTEWWVHDDAIESLLTQFDKGEATGGILREERILVAFLLTQSGRKLLQGSLQTLCDFLKKLILMMTKLTASLIGCHNLSTALFCVKDS